MAVATQNTVDSNVLGAINGGGKHSRGTAQDLQDSFMTLLVTQLKNQDPMNPMDNAEMTSQLAQINTVSGIQELNSALENITGQLDASRVLQAAGLIGKGVLVPGERVLVGDEGATTPFGIELKTPADNVVVTIRDASGQVVSRYELGEMKAGVESFVWDAQLEDGTTAPKGAYSVSVEASLNDKALPVTTLSYALVSGISTASDGTPRLDLGGVAEPVSLEDIRQIL
ncbi:flagellar basal body rod modification protein [Alcanivorax sp. S71-1-4]|jgi:flagellar basal-body rod modification protein FlgD|uniref:flagellar hook assembly protein FlgD n=1 Tax=Alcanivorax sp. S71-1-4 TaxID=1177159 RepID=UPI00135CABEE|nr:flagellar hook assembly protein FlgD [Alcanivorax sp. S71-1-4]KAF0810585.1 flagellar basal body rod modification protein [Alcanivorax sp. S71-1-4]